MHLRSSLGTVHVLQEFSNLSCLALFVAVKCTDHMFQPFYFLGVVKKHGGSFLSKADENKLQYGNSHFQCWVPHKATKKWQLHTDLSF